MIADDWRQTTDGRRQTKDDPDSSSAVGRQPSSVSGPSSAVLRQPSSISRPPSTIVIGLGNPILGDDAVGWRVAEAVQRQLAAEAAGLALAVEFDCVALGGLSLMERLVGYDRAVVVDALVAGGPPGAVSACELEALPDYSSFNSTAPHDASLQTALRLGRMMGARLPQTVWVVGVEAERLYEFSEELTPAVAAAVPVAARRVIDVLRSFSLEEQRHGVP